VSRTRTALAAFFICVTCAGAAQPAHLTISLQIGRTSLDLLDSVSVAVVAHNPGDAILTTKFESPQEDLIEIADRTGSVIWSSAAPPPPRGVAFPPHLRVFVPGTTTVIVRDWNELASAGWSPVAGTYTVRARLLSEKAQPAASATIVLAAPLPPAALPALHAAQVVTLAGTLDAARLVLTGPSGHAPLSRRLIAAPAGVPIVVRGYPTDQRDGTRTFTVTRWAPLGAPAP